VSCEHVDGNISLRRGLARSCNSYACNVFQRLMTQPKFGRNKIAAYDDWQARVRKFGLGSKLDLDMPFERKGRLFTSEEYTKRFGKYWGYTTIISLAIGQGEMSATPLQMANIMAIIANRGYYIKPHLIKAIGEKKGVKKEYLVKNSVDIDLQHFDPVIDGMQDAVNSSFGTARDSAIPDILMCGKTGTVQNPHGKNHSVFVGFAPRDNPKIAIAVIVENAGFGSAYAAPIASYITEQYLKGKLTGNRVDRAEWMKKQIVLPEEPRPKVKLVPKGIDSTTKQAPVITPATKIVENKKTTIATK